jgi:hypothetical protein
MEEWYSKIEEDIRPYVKFLRDNGFNTTCSCGHKMYVDVDFICEDQIKQLYQLLCNTGYDNFNIVITIQMPPEGLPTFRATIYFNNWMGNESKV